MYEEDDYSEENTWTYIALCGEPTLYEGLRFAKDLIIANVILRLIIHAHKEAYLSEMKSNRKALVISLHGWSGVGKNYAATMIAEALYKKGIESKDSIFIFISNIGGGEIASTLLDLYAQGGCDDGDNIRTDRGATDIR
ncbi:hypothetical protein MSG28_000229 [Choristoneura fumiferana]|uniref:Uncharacterized protein n=1 Tax=Choristoneura fumiferana TaxID=7141 RepID=A0ACC0JZP7_CHOFU|nr:hypothetical protein MSG28_000229 [Choristoneura fumiferana]